MFNQINNNNMKKRTVYQLIVDRSGSMAGMERQVVSGFNEQLQAAQGIQRKYPDQEIIMGLRFFDQTVGNNIADFKVVDELLPLSMHDYQLGGTTALLDAIGKSVYDIKTRFGHQIANEDTSVVIIVMTDGYENASRMYTYDDIRRMVTELETTEKWSFTFMGADLDAIGASQSLGINPDNTLSFDKGDYSRVTKQYFEEAAESYASAKERNIKSNNFLSIFRDKDIRKKK
jgi:hypothetical protein